MKSFYFLVVISLALSAIGAQAGTAPSIANGSPTSPVLVNQPYSYTYAFTGSPTPTFSVTPGALPPGLSLSSAGVISGTPTTTGTYTGTVDATNGVSPDATQPFSIDVATTIIPTVPEGVIVFPLLHGTITYLSLPLEGDPTYSGVVSSVTATSITVAVDTMHPAPWTPGTLNTPAQPYFVKFLSGPQAGRIILVTANATNTLTLDTTDHTTQTTPLLSSPSSSFDVQIGNTFEVFQGETLATLFGTGTTQDPLAYLVGGPNIGQADVVAISTVATSPALSYFFDTGKGYWRLYPSTANANNAILYPHSSLAITRRSINGDTTLPMMGRVTDVPLLIKTLSFATCYTSTQYPTDIALSSLQLTNWLKGTSISNSDVLNVWNGSTTPGHFDSYYQLSSDSKWRKYPDRTTDVSSFVIPAGSTISIARRENVSGATSFIQPALPYNSN
jgi:uncharacterized protein (TIGR02597 family)